MAIVVNGSANTIGGLAVGGLPDGTVDADTLATGVGGKVLQVLNVVKKDVFSFTTTANTISTSGDITGLTITITPSNANNKILLMPSLSISDESMYVTFYKNGTLIDQVGDAANDGQGDALQRITFGGETNSIQNTTCTSILQDTAGSTSAITYSIRLGTYHIGATTYTLYINRIDDSDEFTNANVRHARYISTFTVMEIAA